MKSHLGRWLILGLTAAILVLAPSAARAEFLLGVSYSSGPLISIDSTTGSGSLVGSLGAGVNPYGLAAYAGRLYTFDAANAVRQISPVTGSTLATINIGNAPYVGQGGMTFRQDGVGFLSTVLDPGFNLQNDLDSFSLASNTATLIAHTGPTLSGLAFVGNVLYGLGKLDNTLDTVSTSTGATTVVGSLFANPNDPSAAPGSPIESLTAGLNGGLYATLDDRLFTISTTTGLATPTNLDPSSDVGFSSISGLVQASAVPEPASVLLVGLGLAATLVVSRSRRQS